MVGAAVVSVQEPIVQLKQPERWRVTGTMSLGPLAGGYLAALVAFVLIDLVWLGFVAKGIYRAGIGHLMADVISFPAAIAFYLVYVSGLMVFAIAPATAIGGGWPAAATTGALLGLFCYATYDLTNLATLRGWPLGVSIIDIAWGSMLSAVVAAIGAVAARSLGAG